MFSVSWFVLGIFWINLVLCKVCNVGEEDCKTKNEDKDFGPFIDNIVKASDPLRVNVITANLPTLKYQLSNASMTGMKDCFMTRLNIERKDSSIQFNLECPRIIISSKYEVKGNMADMIIEGKGTCTISCKDYVFIFNALIEKNSGEDNKQHVHIKRHDVNGEAKGGMQFEFENLLDNDRVKSKAVHKFVNDNWKIIDNVIRMPIVNSFMALFVENLNAFLKAVPVQNVLAMDSIHISNTLKNNKLVLQIGDQV